MSAKVLVVVVSWNAMQWIDRCLGSVANCGAKADVMVVDNSSTDGTRDRIREKFPQVKLVESGGNLGFGAANNIGFRYALEHGYDYVYLMNQDAWMEKNCLSRLLAAAREEFAVLSPVQKSANGKLDPRFKRKCGKRLKMIKHIAADDTLVVKVPFVMAAHWFIPTSVVRKVGGFSPAFRMYGEDDNYIDRLHRLGLDCHVLKTAEGIHDREGRKDTKERKMRLKCTGALRRLMDPRRCWAFSLAKMPAELLATGIKNLSLIPLSYISSLWSRRRELRALREESLKEGAFLKLQESRSSSGKS